MTEALNPLDSSISAGRDETSSWAVGLAAFAGILLVMIGSFHIVAGVVGLANDTFYLVTEKWTFTFNATTWGWIHLIGGVVLLLTGIFIFSGNVLARTVGVGIAVLSAIANFMWLPYYPVWSVVLIALDVAVIWALTVHGRDIATQ